MERTVEGTHTWFMSQITGKRAQRNPDGTEFRQDMGDYQGLSSVVSSRKPVENDLHWKKTGDIGTVGGSAAGFRGVRKVDSL